MSVNLVYTFTIDGLEVRGVPVPDPAGLVPAGFYLAKDGLTGLRGGVTMIANDVQRTSGDGLFPTPARYGARVSGWTVHTLAHTRAERDEFDELLTGIGGARRRFPVVIRMDGPERTTLARVGEVPDPVPRSRRVGGLWVSTSSFQLVHADPFLYGETVEAPAGTSITLKQRGGVEAWPVLTVTGTGAAYTVTGGGATFHMTTPLPSGVVDRIDAATRSVLRGGARLPSGFSGWVAPVPRRGHPITYTVSAGQVAGTVRPRSL